MFRVPGMNTARTCTTESGSGGEGSSLHSLSGFLPPLRATNGYARPVIARGAGHGATGCLAWDANGTETNTSHAPLVPLRQHRPLAPKEASRRDSRDARSGPSAGARAASRVSPACRAGVSSRPVNARLSEEQRASRSASRAGLHVFVSMKEGWLSTALWGV